jgi:hypothetical protein
VQVKIVKMVGLVEEFAKGNTQMDEETVRELESFGGNISSKVGIYKNADPDEDDEKPKEAVDEGRVIHVVSDSGVATSSSSSSSAAAAAPVDDPADEELAQAMSVEIYPTTSRGRIRRRKLHHDEKY